MRCALRSIVTGIRRSITLITRKTTKIINKNTTKINNTLSSWLHFVVWIMFTPKLRCSVLARSTKKTEKVKSIFPTVFCKQFCLCRFALSLDVEKWFQKAMFQVTERYTERENLIIMRKLDACDFFPLCNDCKQTQ